MKLGIDIFARKMFNLVVRPCNLVPSLFLFILNILQVNVSLTTIFSFGLLHVLQHETAGSENTEGLSKEELGRLVASRWTGDKTDHNPGDSDDVKDIDHAEETSDVNKDVNEDDYDDASEFDEEDDHKYDENYSGDRSYTDNDGDDHMDDDFTADDHEDSSSYKSDSDDESGQSGMWYLSLN